MATDNMVTVTEAAKLTGYTEQNITYMNRKGRLIATRRGRRYFINKKDLAPMLLPVADVKLV